MGKGVSRKQREEIEIIPTKTSTDGIMDIKDSTDEAERAAIRERVGLTYEELCKTVKQGLTAEVVIVDEKGNIKKRVPANEIRAKFITSAVDIIGAKKAEGGAQKCPSIIIILPNGQRL